MLICAISDTHGQHAALNIPACDILIHCGDMCLDRDPHVQANYINNEFLPWFDRQHATHKVFIAGNHDFVFVEHPGLVDGRKYPSIHYLCENSVTLSGLRIWGSPWTPWFMDWAFNGPRDPILAKKFFDNLYSSIPADTDIVVSHGPPQGILDNGLGCASLRRYVDRIRPHACIFGHIHEGYGTKRVDNTIFANASVLDVKYNLVNTPIVFSIDIQKKQ